MDTQTFPAEPEPQKYSPSIWRLKKRPPEPHPKAAAAELHEDRQKRLHFDAYFAGARSLGRWEDEWPLLTEFEFDNAMKAAQQIELGGHRPDGSHPRAPKATR